MWYSLITQQIITAIFHNLRGPDCVPQSIDIIISANLDIFDAHIFYNPPTNLLLLFLLVPGSDF